MLHNKPDMHIPTETTKSDFSNQLNDFFISKIEKIRAEFSESGDTRCHDFDETVVKSPLRRFQPVTIDNVSKMVRKSAAKTCV